MGISKPIQDHIAGKRVVPSIPPNRSVLLEGTDEPGRSDRRNGISALGLFIEYRDAQGALSARRIVCRHYDPSAGMFTAWCFEREALRDFRLDRIVSAACTETGELFDLTELIAALRVRGLPVRNVGLNLVLRLLTFLMRCDGVHPSEPAVLEHAVTSYALRFDGDDRMVDDALRLANTMAPDAGDFLRGLRWMGLRPDGPRLASFLRNQARAIVDADGRLSEEEVVFGLELDKALSAIAARA